MGIVVKFELLNSISGLNFRNFAIYNIKFIKSKMHIIACKTTNILKINVTCYLLI